MKKISKKKKRTKVRCVEKLDRVIEEMEMLSEQARTFFDDPEDLNTLLEESEDVDDRGSDTDKREAN